MRFMKYIIRELTLQTLMLDRIYDINREISRKRQEFGMDAYDVSYSGTKTGSGTTDTGDTE